MIRVFPAWPVEWSAQFKLLARGSFLVSAAIEGGRVRVVELESQAGAECRLRNPWGDGGIVLYRDGKKAETMKGPLLRFITQKGERIAVRLL